MIDIFSYKLGQKSGGGSGGGADWNASEGEAGYIKNRTHYEEVTEVMGDTLTWDGNTEGRVCAGISYKISDAIPTLTDLENGVYLCLYPDGWYEYHTFTERFEGVITDEYFQFVIVTEKAAGVDLGSITFPESGTYFIADSGAGVYVAALTIPDYTGFKTTTTTLKTLDPKYLPEALQFGETTVKGDTLTWDGDTWGLETVEDSGLRWAKVSDVFPPVPTAACKYVMVSEGTETLTEQSAMLMSSMGLASDNSWTSADLAYLCVDNEVLFAEGALILERGVWFPYGNGNYMKSLTIPDYTGFTQTVIKPMDEKYMPILTSPSGKKYKLTVDDSGAVSAVEVTE